MNVGSLPIKRVQSTYSEGACVFRGERKWAGFSFISNMKKGKVKQAFTHSSLCRLTWNSHSGCNHRILCHNTLLRGDRRDHSMFLPHRDSEASPVSPIFVPLDASSLFSKNQFELDWPSFKEHKGPGVCGWQHSAPTQWIISRHVQTCADKCTVFSLLLLHSTNPLRIPRTCTVFFPLPLGFNKSIMDKWINRLWMEGRVAQWIQRNIFSYPLWSLGKTSEIAAGSSVLIIKR